MKLLLAGLLNRSFTDEKKQIDHLRLVDHPDEREIVDSAILLSVPPATIWAALRYGVGEVNRRALQQIINFPRSEVGTEDELTAMAVLALALNRRAVAPWEHLMNLYRVGGLLSYGVQALRIRDCLRLFQRRGWLMEDLDAKTIVWIFNPAPKEAE